MTTRPELLTDDFRALSARLGRDPLQVQGAGGNTSIKDGEVMWIKASGTELANARSDDIFVSVDRKAALAEARGLQGDGSCKTTVLDPAISLRPSIETTFHAFLDYPVVAHTHSVATLVHAIGACGREAASVKLEGLPFAQVVYAKPGLPLTREIMQQAAPGTQIFILHNHGLIVCGASVAEVSRLLGEVEARLAMPERAMAKVVPESEPPAGYRWADESWLAHDQRTCRTVLAGSYYPDHVVFLGPALPVSAHNERPPVILIEGVGTAVRLDASSSQRALLRCLSDVMARLPEEWDAQPIGREAEAGLLNWDAEKYRQALATRP